MNDRLTEIRVGIVVLASILVLAILIVYFGELPTLMSDQYALHIRFERAPGVTVDTPVRKSGILIGRVSKVDLIEDGTGGVLVSARIDGNRKLSKTERCRINTSSLLGDATLEFVPGGQPAPGGGIYYQNEDFIANGMVAKDPLEVFSSVEDVTAVIVRLESKVESALGAMEIAGAQVGGAANNLTALIQNNQNQFQRIMSKAEQGMNTLELAMNSIGSFVRDDEIKENLRRAVSEVPELLKEAKDMMTSFRAVAVRAEKNLENIEGLTEPLGQSGDAILEQVSESLGRLQELGDSLEQVPILVDELVVFSKKLNESDGTLGALVEDRQLYDRLNSAAYNVQYLTQRLRPIVNDARVTMDKVARDPSQLGLRGVFNRQQVGTKY